MLRHLLLTLTILCGAVFAGGLPAQEIPGKVPDVLEGTLRVHPKFHYRYYIDGIGDGQECALFQADEQLAKIPVGSQIRIQGDVRSKYFGSGPKGPPSAVISTWIIYMDVAQVQQLAQPQRALK